MVTRRRTDFSTPERQSPLLRIPRAGGGGRGIDNNPPVSLFFPGDDSRQSDEAARMRDRLADMLDSIGMSKVGRPLFEEESEEEREEEEAPQQPSLSNYKDPYIAGESGNFLITTWGDLWQKAEFEGGAYNA